jgi:hypothetical protein
MKRGRRGAVSEDVAQFGDQACEGGIRDERRRPEPFVQLGLRKRRRPALDKDPKQLERLGRQMPLAVARP